MSAPILVAGIGNIFQGDDAFGVSVVQRLSEIALPCHVRLMDAGIRSIDLAFALLEGHDLTILVDATARGGSPGTLYEIEIRPQDIPDICDETSVVNSHSLDPVRVLALARSMGALLANVVLIGCEPEIIDCDDTGNIGLSETVAAALEPAVRRIQGIIQQFPLQQSNKRTEEVNA